MQAKKFLTHSKSGARKWSYSKRVFFNKKKSPNRTKGNNFLSWDSHNLSKFCYDLKWHKRRGKKMRKKAKEPKHSIFNLVENTHFGNARKWTLKKKRRKCWPCLWWCIIEDESRLRKKNGASLQRLFQHFGSI